MQTSLECFPKCEGMVRSYPMDQYVQQREQFGFRAGDRGTHSSRTMMLAELRRLLDEVPAEAAKSVYRERIIHENILAKPTQSARTTSAQKLVELYGLDPASTLFRLLRFFWGIEEVAQPTLALLCALARDPLFRTTIELIPHIPLGEILHKSEIEQAIVQAHPHRFTAKTLSSIARNISSSWTQSGHLSGKKVKIRTSPIVTSASLTYAIALGYLEGYRGQQLLETSWIKVLGLSRTEQIKLILEASQRGWLDYHSVGEMVEIRLPHLLTAEEQKAH